MGGRRRIHTTGRASCLDHGTYFRPDCWVCQFFYIVAVEDLLHRAAVDADLARRLWIEAVYGKACKEAGLRP